MVFLYITVFGHNTESLHCSNCLLQSNLHSFMIIPMNKGMFLFFP